MLLTAGDGNSFTGLWNTQGPINDPFGNKSTSDDVELLFSTGDFKAQVESNWGEPIWVRLFEIHHLVPRNLKPQ